MTTGDLGQRVRSEPNEQLDTDKSSWSRSEVSIGCSPAAPGADFTLEPLVGLPECRKEAGGVHFPRKITRVSRANWGTPFRYSADRSAH